MGKSEIIEIKCISSERKFSLIASSAIDIAEELNACAIITFSQEMPEIKTRIPILVFTGRKTSFINEFTRHIEETDKNLYERLESRVKSGVDDISDASVIAFVNNLIGTKGVVVGILRMNDNDSIIVYDLSTNKILRKLMECTENADPKVVRSVLNVALQIAFEGREGKRFGAAFIIGDSDEVLRRSHQLVLNPFEGQLKENCDISNPNSWETVKSFAQLDGVFVINEKGIIRAAGRYLDINARDVQMEKGLGGRHTSAAAITRDTETVAITVSTSGGIIRIFKDGMETIKIKPDIMLVQ